VEITFLLIDLTIYLYTYSKWIHLPGPDLEIARRTNVRLETMYMGRRIAHIVVNLLKNNNHDTFSLNSKKKKYFLKMENPYACTICFRTFREPIVLNCGHTFDKECIQTLNICPLCRTPIKTRATNWQLLQIIQDRNNPIEEFSSSEEDIDRYQPVREWTSLYPGVLLKYQLRAKNHYRNGWLISVDSINQTIEVYQKHSIQRIPIQNIVDAWYHPDFVKNTDLLGDTPGCCFIS